MTKNFITVILCLIFFLNSLLVIGQTNYYIDAIGGSDANNGTSIATPWQNLSQLYSLSVVAGSTINLSCNSIWTGQQLKFNGSGNAANPIIVNQYGTGAMPIIHGNGLITANQGVVYLYNQQYIEINNLEITNTPNTPSNTDFFVGLYQNGTNPLGADRRGVMIAISNYGIANHIYLKNLNVHHVKGQLGSGTTTINGATPSRTGGIYFTVLKTLEQTAAYSRFNDILIDGCNINYCENIGLAFNNEWNVYYPGSTEYTDWYNRRFTNIRVSNNILHHIGKNAMIIRCTDETGLIDHNVCYETAIGTTGNTMFSARAKGTVFQNNEGYFNRATTQSVDPGTIDGSMYDADFGSVGIIFQNSYSHDNSHGLFWGCNSRGSSNNTTGIPDPGDVGCTARYNISQNDMGDLVFLNYASAGNEIYNNVFYIKAGSKPNIIHENSGNNHTYNFYNNIIYNLSSGAKYALGSGTGVQTRNISYNVFYGNIPSTQPADANKLTSDPLFISPGSGTIGINSLNGYKIQSGSSSIGSGTVLTNNATQDFFGYNLPVFGGAVMPSRGVFEFQAALPVTLIDFRGEALTNTNNLFWVTTNEINNAGFKVQRSADGIIFTDLHFIGSQSANGNSAQKLTYTFSDGSPIPGISYYRLKQIDINGRETFSQVIKLQKNLKLSGSLMVFPNPVVAATFTLAFTSLPADTYNLEIFNTAGKRMVYQQLEYVGYGAVPVTIAEILKNDTYILRISNKNSELSSLFIKN